MPLPTHPAPIELHLPVNEEGTHTVDALSQQSGLSKQKIKQAMQKGAVWLSRGKTTRPLRRANSTLRAGDTLHLYYNAEVLAEEPPVPVLIADEGSYSVWYKPYGLRSQGSKWGDHCSIGRWIERHLEPQRPAFIVHRLDRAATGLIIIAHSKTMAAAFSRLFRERKLSKRYRVVVHGHFPAGVSPLRLDDELDGKQAISHARLLSYDETRERSLVEVDIETGRKHQIRRHLSMAGFPVVGDRLYGTGSDKEDLQLSAIELTFISPDDGKERHYRLEPGTEKCPTVEL